MADSKPNSRRPAWVDLSSDDPAASREFYAALFGWEIEVSDDPQYGGYAIAHLPGEVEDVAGIGKKASPDGPAFWAMYIGTDDAAAASATVEAAGGTTIMPAFGVGDMGTLAVFQDPTGAFFSVWEPVGDGSFRAGEPGTFIWGELSARNIAKAHDFYPKVFGWDVATSPMGEGEGDYTEFQIDGQSILGGLEMPAGVPAEVPSYWMVYFAVNDVEDAFKRAVAAGATGIVPAVDFPGGQFAIVADPQGAMFGVMRMNEAS
jgi:predicted enzyme related to lactoylglutathione lyase